ncbi:MAG: transcription antitermination factor NusB [Desulfobacterales bacterium]|nr:transcription antitermination factor NusB [Desulfobacterales bacterium]
MGGTRRQSRELALQALFFLDMNPEMGCEEGLNAFWEAREDEDSTESAKDPFCMELVEGTLGIADEIDTLINQFSKNWRISRMPVVDRNIMRLATFELLKRSDIPPSVTINEAVEIGKKYGTRDSGPFINGILDQIRLSM